MSALPPKAVMCGAAAYVCFGPKADIDRIMPSHRHTTEYLYFASILVVFALVLADQLSL
ncbi:MAG: hypothetical protein WAK90_04545 [Pseudolabrys sp.]